MQRRTIVWAATIVVWSASGCISAPHLADANEGGRAVAASDGQSATSRFSALLFGKKNKAPTPPFQKSYSELQSDFTNTGVVAPRIGYPAPKPAPTGIKKWTSSIANSNVVTSIKSAFKPKEQKPTPFGTPKKKSFFSKKTEEPDPEDAVSVFTKSSVGPDIFVIMARHHVAKGDVKGAIENYQKALNAQKHNLAATTDLARLYDAQGRVDEARELFADATKYHSKSASAWNDLGTFQAKHGDTEAAVRSMKHAIEIDPHRDLYRNNIATFLVDAGQPLQALAHLQAVHPPAVAHYSLGYMLEQRGRTVEALAYFRTAYQQDPSFEEARMALEMLAGRAGPLPQQPPGRPVQSVASRKLGPPGLESEAIHQPAAADEPGYSLPAAQQPPLPGDSHDWRSDDLPGADDEGPPVSLNDDQDGQNVARYSAESQYGQDGYESDGQYESDSQYDNEYDGARNSDVPYLDHTSDTSYVPEDGYDNAELTEATDGQVVARLRIGEPSQQPPDAVVLDEAGQPGDDDTFVTSERPGGTVDQVTPDKVGNVGNTEARSLASQFAVSPGASNPRLQKANPAAKDEYDDPLSQALRQAVREGDASVRHWW